jgi:hypothetical protein
MREQYTDDNSKVMDFKNDVVLKQWVIAEIRKNGTLKGLVADELKISTRTLDDILPSNPKRLTQVGILRIVENYLKQYSQDHKDIKYIDLIEEKEKMAA